MVALSPEFGAVSTSLEQPIPVSTGKPRPTMSPTDDLGPPLRTATWLMCIASLVFLLARLWSKFMRHKKLFADDAVLIASWIMLMATNICGTISVSMGFGKHASEIRFGDINRITIVGLLAVTFVITSIAWSKTSWAMTMLSVSPTRVERGCIWFGIVSSNLLFIASILSYWVLCTPLHKAWRPLSPGTCASPRIGMTISMVASCYSGLMDLALAIQPWRILWDLRISRDEKAGVAIAMSMGIIAAICAFLKASVMPDLVSPDFSYVGVPLSLWGVAEPAATIIAASLPMVRVLIQSWRGKGAPEAKVALERIKTEV